MSEFLSVPQMKKLQEVFLKNLSKRAEQKESIDNSEYLSQDFLVSMASSREYLDFILEQLSEVEGISWRAMMGEYPIYCKDKLVGGIYDDRFLLKSTNAAMNLMPEAQLEIPYEGAKEMLLVDNVENREFLKKLFDSIYEEIPVAKRKKV